MSFIDIVLVVGFFGLLIALSPVLGKWLFEIMDKGIKIPFIGRFETVIYRILRIVPTKQMDWKTYLKSVLIFSFVSFVLLFLLLVLQDKLPLNPANVPGMSWHLALNTSISFVTNTNWQFYSGETGVSYLVQAIGLTVQNFASPAVGFGVMLALIRGIRSKKTELEGSENGLGNFWVDITRIIIYVLVPISIVSALVLVSQGVVQNINPYTAYTSIQGEQVINNGQPDLIPGGMAASQVAIKQLGTNGGGFFGTNSAHPFENPTLFSNLFEAFLILIIPMSIPFLYGRMLGKKSEGYAIFAAMGALLLAGLVLELGAELGHGTLEGKELRIGMTQSALWTEATSVTSNGSVNSMLDSYSPLGGMIPLVNILLGEVIYGGIGSGMYGMILFAIAAVFIAGLMIGRSPEFQRKKIEARDIKLTMIGLTLPAIAVLILLALASILPETKATLTNAGPHGFSEMLYAIGSGIGNNGSAFAGLGSNLPWNLIMSIAILIGRFAVIVPVMALAGNLGAKNTLPTSDSNLKTDSPIFVVLLIIVILIIGGLTFFPALTLGPILDHLTRFQ